MSQKPGGGGLITYIDKMMTSGVRTVANCRDKLDDILFLARSDVQDNL